jgi:uncharacterized membrane protein
LYALISHPLTLCLAQLVLVVSGVFPLYWFARRRLPEWIAAGMAITFFLYPPLIWNILFDVHAVTLAIPLVLWAVWAIEARRWWIYALCIALLSISKENTGFTIAAIGGLMVWKVRPRWIGIVTTLVGIGMTTFLLFFVIPHYRHSGGHFFLEQYAEFGTTTGGVLRGIFLHPSTVLRTMFDREGLLYLFHLFGPHAGLALFSFPYILAAGPELGINSLSAFPSMHTIFFQYTSLLTPIILLCSVLSLSWVLRRNYIQQFPHRTYWVAGFVFFTSLTFYFYDAPFIIGRHHAMRDAFHTSEYRDDVAAAFASVGENEYVAVSNIIGPQFAARDRIIVLPKFSPDVTSVVAYFHGAEEAPDIIEVRRLLDRLMHDPAWEIVVVKKDFVYLKKK